MKNVCVCGGCGRTIESAFIYCPWCGQTKAAANSKAALDNVFDQLEKKQAENRNQRIHKLEMELEALEKDLNVLVLSAEMAK